jgi:hypothetical protein
MTTDYQIPGRRIVHRRQSCQRLTLAFRRGAVAPLEKKPSNCTICDHCQALDARDKREVKRKRK